MNYRERESERKMNYLYSVQERSCYFPNNIDHEIICKVCKYYKINNI